MKIVKADGPKFLLGWPSNREGDNTYISQQEKEELGTINSC